MSLMNLKLNIITQVILIYIWGSISVFASPVEKTGVKDYEGVKGTVKVTVSEDKITIADSIQQGGCEFGQVGCIIHFREGNIDWSLLCRRDEPFKAEFEGDHVAAHSFLYRFSC